MSKIQSGETISKASIITASASVMDDLNGALAEENLQRSAFGVDQLNDGAIFSASSFGTTRREFMHKHVTYPETADGPHWSDSVHWKPGSTADPGAGVTLEGVRHFNERKFWQRALTYGSSRTTSTEMQSCNNDGNGFTIFFNLNCRIKGTWKEDAEDGSTFLTKRALAGRRGWVSIIFYFQMSHKAPKIMFSPMTALGCFALEYNDSTLEASAFIDIEQVLSFHETFFINRGTLQRLAYFNGYNPASSFEMGDDADFSNAKFGWSLHAGIDRWDSDHNKDTGIDAPAFGSNSHKNKNGQIFALENGSSSFMCLDYFPEDEAEAYGWLR